MGKCKIYTAFKKDNAILSIVRFTVTNEKDKEKINWNIASRAFQQTGIVQTSREQKHKSK